MGAMTEDLDTCIGSVIKKLDDLGITNNTFIIYMSDNGGKSQLLKGGKTVCDEGGLRVPLIVAGPGVRSGVYCNEPVISYDIFPTLIDFVSRTGSMRVVIAQTTSFQSRMSMSSSTTTMNLVYMNWRRWLHTPIITRRAWPG
mgnify:CR=1 FL=1